MIQYAYLDADGYVLRAGGNQHLPVGAIELPNGISGRLSLDMMQVDGVFVSRPELKMPDITAFETNGRAVQWVDLPSGSVAEITDTEIGAVLATLPAIDGGIQIELPDPGHYRIDLIPPRPYLPLTINIEVPA